MQRWFYGIVRFLHDALNVARENKLHAEHIAWLYLARVQTLTPHLKKKKRNAELWNKAYKHKAALQKVNANKLSMQAHVETGKIIHIGAKWFQFDCRMFL